MPRASDSAALAGIIEGLFEWIGEHTHYDVSRTLAEPPSVSFCAEGTRIDYEDEEVLVDPMVKAAYDMRARRIHLVKPWEVSKVRDRSALLHELIHDVQHLNRAWACKGEPEWEAYKLQDAWLAEQGVASNFDWLQIFFLARCPRDIHP